MGKRPERVTAVASLGEVEWKTPGVCPDFINRGSELILEAVSDMRPGFFVVVIDDLVEIFLDERVEREAARHWGSAFFDSAPEFRFIERLDFARGDFLVATCGLCKRFFR